MTSEFWLGMAGIGGTLIATIATSAFHLKSEKMKYKAQINEKIVDKRIEAHIALNDIVALFKTIMDHQNTGGVFVFYPSFFESKGDFLKMHGIWKTVNFELKMWSSSRLNKETGFIDSYLCNLITLIGDCTDEQLQDVGTIVTNDFADFSDILSEVLQKFYHQDIYEMSSNSFGVGGNYSEAEIIQKLDATELGKNHKQIVKILNKGVEKT